MIPRGRLNEVLAQKKEMQTQLDAMAAQVEEQRIGQLTEEQQRQEEFIRLQKQAEGSKALQSQLDQKSAQLQSYATSWLGGKSDAAKESIAGVVKNMGLPGFEGDVAAFQLGAALEANKAGLLDLLGVTQTAPPVPPVHMGQPGISGAQPVHPATKAGARSALRKSIFGG